MFTPTIRVIQGVTLGVCCLLHAVLACAQSINPNATEGLIEVQSLSLEGFSSIEGYPLSILELRSQLTLERQRFGESLTVDQLHQIADAMTIYVRRKGFAFHTVYLPPQKVTKGDVRFVIQEGVLFDVYILNKTELPSHRFERVFKNLIGKMLYAPDVEARVEALKAQTGVQVFAFYSRGSKPGQARLNIRAEPKRQHFASLKVDNFGAATSGEYRAIGQWSVAQATNRFDTFSIAVLAAVDDVANYYGSISYTLPTASLNYEWDISASNNQFELGDRFANLGLEGDATILKAGLTYNRKFAPAKRERWRLGWYSKTNDLDSDDTAVTEERSEAISLEWRKSLQWPKSGLASQTVLAFSMGDMERGANDGEEFTKLDLNTRWLKGFGSKRLQSVVSTSLSVQQASVNLPSVEAFSLTGPYGVRGFASGVFSADDAILVSGEWSLPGLLKVSEASWYIEPFAFVDWATGKQKALGDNPESEATYAGAGGGFRFGVGKHISGQLYGAGRIEGEKDGAEEYGEQLWRFELRLH